MNFRHGFLWTDRATCLSCQPIHFLNRKHLNEFVFIDKISQKLF